ncbi:hypothetical protein DI272_18630 [Streptomyces sp. Act143]|uniref:hypothetical protein n=1 Tax=Streptomyces sp. Act143 TaxID=2200760 RepID=UPI000D679C31|nr:hypothetical protein [Streptomyces sp. Act143]PWI15952.1 hypothetical protein DI272_18630 [Streptomyces sp. Act143]
MTRYYASPDGLSFATTGDGPIAGPSLPDDWTEITAEEYQARIAAAREEADANAAEFIAADGDVPPPPEGTPPPVVPIDELPVGDGSTGGGQ